MIDRKSYEITQGNGDIFHRVVVTTEDCKIHSPESAFLQNELFRLLHETPEIYLCGSQNFEKMTMTHDGAKWVVVLTATERKRPQ